MEAVSHLGRVENSQKIPVAGNILTQILWGKQFCNRNKSGDAGEERE